MDKNKNYIIVSLDVGGTNIKGGAVNQDAELLGRIHEIPSPSTDDAATIINKFITLLEEIKNNVANTDSIKAYGIGMPGPFDYINGISQMKHKFSSLFGINLKEAFEKQLQKPVFFINDAAAFGLGVVWKEYPKEKRLLAITLGTGLGSGFLINGKIVSSVKGITENGEIWNLPYQEGILEDKISKHAIEQDYLRRSGSSISIKEIAEKARKGDQAAKEVFEQFTFHLGSGLASTIADFQPTRIVFGGKISQAFDLFGEKAEKVFIEKAGYKVYFTKSKEDNLAIYGGARHAFDQLHI